jgi:putative Mn2+ efflux pump MntP
METSWAMEAQGFSRMEAQGLHQKMQKKKGLCSAISPHLFAFAYILHGYFIGKLFRSFQETSP